MSNPGNNKIKAPPKYLPRLGILWLTGLAGFLWGATMVQFEVFPARLLNPPLKQIIEF